MLEFEYIAFNVGTPESLKLVHLPAIEITLESNGNKYSPICLIDSGAEYCILDAEIGEALGLVIRDGEPTTLSGVQDPKFTAYLHDIEYELGGRKYPALVAFVYNPKMGQGILGRNGFFDYFKICLDQRSKRITLDPY